MKVPSGKKRKIWLIRDGEILPCDGKDVRLFRMGLIGQIAAVNPENEITWWCGTLNHFTKELRMEQDGEISLQENYRLKFIHGTMYKKNMSFRRLYYQYHQGKHFVELAEKEEKPDLILCSIPTPELAYFAVKYGKKHHVPVFLDIRDLFPDIYADFCNPRLRPLVEIGIIPFRQMVKKALRGASGMIATSEKFLGWGLRYAGRKKTENAQ